MTPCRRGVAGGACVFLAVAVLASDVSTNGQSGTPPTPVFEVTSVKASRSGGNFRMAPWGTDHFSATSIPLRLLVAFAFVVDDDKVLNLPGWALSARYDVNARAEGGATLTYPAAAPLLHQLVIDRFKLSAHRESLETEGYALVVTKGGSKLKPSAAAISQGIATNPDALRAPSTDLRQFVFALRRVVGRPVVDETKLQGLFDIALDYAPEGTTDSDRPSVYTALQEQLGLRLESRRVLWEHVIVDHIERPAPD